jgi:hypothetical protein
MSLEVLAGCCCSSSIANQTNTLQLVKGLHTVVLFMERYRYDIGIHYVHHGQGMEESIGNLRIGGEEITGIVRLLHG